MTEGNGRLKQKIVDVLSHLNVAVDFLRQMKNSFLGKYSIKGILVETLCIILSLIDKWADKLKLKYDSAKAIIRNYNNNKNFKKANKTVSKALNEEHNNFIKRMKTFWDNKAKEILDAEKNKLR